MLKVCISGVGKVGGTYSNVLAGADVELYYVDPKFSQVDPICLSFPKERCFENLDNIPEFLLSSFDFFVVSSPTNDHLESLRAILRRSPGARVLVEKPFVPLNMFSDLQQLLKEYPDCRVLENSQYEQSALVDRILAVVPEIAQHRERLRSVYVELTKNRVYDNRCGRFRDKDFHLIGYEGPHMIAVCEKLMSSLYQRSLLDEFSVVCVKKNIANETEPDEGTACFDVRGRALPPVQIYTSTVGEIGDDQVWSGRHKKIGGPRILYREPECYRIIRLDFDTFTIIVRVEPQKLTARSLLRNANTVYRIAGRRMQKLGVFHLNLFADAIFKNFERLADDNFDSKKSLESSYRRLGLLDRLARLYIGAPNGLSLQENRGRQLRMASFAATRIEVSNFPFEVTESNLDEAAILRQLVRRSANRLRSEKDVISTTELPAFQPDATER